jgi:hypothetical protein
MRPADTRIVSSEMVRHHVQPWFHHLNEFNGFQFLRAGYILAALFVDKNAVLQPGRASWGEAGECSRFA